MLKKGMILLLFFIMCSVSYGEILRTINLGETREYLTQNDSISVEFTSLDTFRDRATFKINSVEYSLLPLQRRNIGSLSFMYTQVQGKNLKTAAATFILEGYVPFFCPTQCDNITLVKFVRLFDHLDATFSRKLNAKEIRNGFMIIVETN